MEGHVNHGFARYITSSPFGFSLEGLNNKLKLLVHFKNNHELTIEDYLKDIPKEDLEIFLKVIIKMQENIRKEN